MPPSGPLDQANSTRQRLLQLSSRNLNRAVALKDLITAGASTSVSKIRTLSSAAGDNICGICFEAFTTLCKLQPCQHQFDYECIYSWFNSIREGDGPSGVMNCPLCRGVVQRIKRTNPTTIVDAAELFSPDRGRDNNPIMNLNHPSRRNLPASRVPSITNTRPAPHIPPRTVTPRPLNRRDSPDMRPGARVQSVWNDSRMTRPHLGSSASSNFIPQRPNLGRMTSSPLEDRVPRDQAMMREGLRLVERAWREMDERSRREALNGMLR